jgi:hypothetical protein
MNQQRQNTRSTQTRAPSTAPALEPTYTGKTEFVYATIVDSGQIRSDLTGRFPTTSAKGNKYVLVLYDYDTNNVLTEPMKSRGDQKMFRAYNKLIQELVDHGFKPRLQRLDNECSSSLRSLLNQHDIQFQLAPPYMHRRNAAERAIQTFKNHFIAGLRSVDPNFPLRLWDRLLPQATITLNMLRQSRINPKVSAHAQLYGHYDFNHATMAPPGTRVIAHEIPQQRASWDPHGVDGWYLVPAPDRYRCFRVHINKTTADIIVDTVEFFPAKVTMPRTASKDMATIAAQELTHAIMHPSFAAPFGIIGGAQLEALPQLATIFNATLPPYATGGYVPIPSSTNTTSPSAPSGSSSQPTPACAPNTPPLPRAKIPLQATPRRQPVCSPTFCPRPAPSPRVDPSRSPAPSVRLPQAPSPRVNPSRAPPPSARLSQAPSPRVRPTRVPPPLGATPDQVQHPPDPLAQASPQHAAAQLDPGLQGTNLYGDFVDVCEEDQPPRHRTRSQTAQHSAHSVHSVPMTNAVIRPTMGANMECRGLITDKETFPTWDRAAANEFGRLAQGVGGRIEGSNTIYFIPRSAVPPNKTVTYGRFVVDVRPNKEEVHRVRLTVGGNLIKYDGDVLTRSADLTTSKCLWNSVISTTGAKYMCLDVKNIYLGTPMEHFEYLRIPMKLIPLEIITQYALLPLVSDGHIYIEVQKGVYGLPQAGILANLLLAK